MKTRLTTVLVFLISFFSFSQEYPIHITDNGYIIVQVKVSDSITGNFILDTGAGVNVVSGKMFEKIASQAVKKGYFTGFRHDGDRIDGEIYEIPYLALGEIKQNNAILGVYPPLDNMGIDGLLSLKFFEDKPFSIDFKNKKIVFLTNDDSKKMAEQHTTVPIQIYQHTNVALDIFIPITVNDDIEILAEFDTGSGFHTYIFNPGYIEDLKVKKSELTSQKYITQLSREERTDTIAKLKSISIGKENQVAVKKNDISALFREGLIYNALIGSGLFRDKTITIDIPNKAFIIHN